jgi:hypothetical protein
MEAPARDDEGEDLEEVENPGEHRAPDGLNNHLETTNSRGEKGPEDEPLSRCTACPCLEREPGFGLARGMNREDPV